MDVFAGAVDIGFSNDGIFARTATPNASENYRKAWKFSYDALQGGVQVPGQSAGIQFDLGSVVKDALKVSIEEVDGKEKYVGLDRTKIVSLGKKMGICALVRAPITATKKAIKEYTSIERMGGNGAAEAQGIKSIAVSIPTGAQIPNDGSATGTYNFFFNYNRKVDVRSYESSVVPLDDPAYNADKISDKDLVDLLMSSLNDEDAVQTLNRMAVKSVRREISTDDDDIYNPYTLRTAGMHTLQLYIIPRQTLASGNKTGNFAFTTDSTIVPVTTMTAAIVSRSNMNATARAYVHFGKVRMRLRNGVILSN